MKTVSIATGLLSGPAAPSRLSLALPGASVIVNRRRDVESPEEAARAASAPSSGNGTATVWVGEVVGARRAGSSAIFVTAENGGVYGKVTYIERKTNKQRTFTVSSAASIGPRRILLRPEALPCMYYRSAQQLLLSATAQLGCSSRHAASGLHPACRVTPHDIKQCQPLTR